MVAGAEVVVLILIFSLLVSMHFKSTQLLYAHLYFQKKNKETGELLHTGMENVQQVVA
jgi:hypothetical protein